MSSNYAMRPEKVTTRKRLEAGVIDWREVARTAGRERDSEGR